MPIISECPDCNHPFLRNVEPPPYVVKQCENCGTMLVVQMTRFNGKTYTQKEFEERILPNLSYERLIHPDTGDVIYGDPSKVDWM